MSLQLMVSLLLATVHISKNEFLSQFFIVVVNVWFVIKQRHHETPETQH